jgi:tyrosyl-tRNA synthetase
MSWPDSMLVTGFTLLTDIPLEEIEEITINPMEAKKRLAKEIIIQLASSKEADSAKEEFENVVQKGNIPENRIIQSFVGNATIVDILSNSGAASSRSEAKRFVSQGSVDINGQRITDPQFSDLPAGTIIKSGKKDFIEIK